ncbi:MAG: nucleoside 2-deoxyribosyltransferase [Solirubrobacteraceae bacterium]
MVKVYVASPLGFSLATKSFYETEVLDKVRAAGFDPLDPWEDPQADREFEKALELPVSEARQNTLRAINTRLAAKNTANIEQADALLAILDGTDVDSGTAAEIGFAAALKKPIVGLRLDKRQAGDNEGAKVNMQVEWFMGSGDHLVFSMNDAIRLLGSLTGP